MRPRAATSRQQHYQVSQSSCPFAEYQATEPSPFPLVQRRQDALRVLLVPEDPPQVPVRLHTLEAGGDSEGKRGLRQGCCALEVANVSHSQRRAVPEPESSLLLLRHSPCDLACGLTFVACPHGQVVHKMPASNQGSCRNDVGHIAMPSEESAPAIPHVQDVGSVRPEHGPFAEFPYRFIGAADVNIVLWNPINREDILTDPAGQMTLLPCRLLCPSPKRKPWYQGLADVASLGAEVELHSPPSITRVNEKGNIMADACFVCARFHWLRQLLEAPARAEREPARIHPYKSVSFIAAWHGLVNPSVGCTHITYMAM